MLLVPLTSKVVRIDRFGTSHRIFQFPNDPDCERKMGQICPQTKETILKIQLGSKHRFVRQILKNYATSETFSY